MNNHYAVLGVLPTASEDEIKSSYRQLVKRFHPDVAGGNARFFARVRDAYEVLSQPEQRRVYDARWHASAVRARTPAGAGPGSASAAMAAAAEEARAARSQAPMPVLTRIMSITVPRTGRFQLQGLIGDIHVVPTTVENLWDTTLKKFGDTDRDRLARHVIQIRLSGERDLVRSMMPRPTDFGVEFEQASPEEKQHRMRTFLENLIGRSPFGGLFGGRGFGLYGAHLPLTLQVTVPKGTPLFLRDVTGAITVGNVEGEVVAKLLGGVLRTGRIGRAHLTLNGGSRAFLANVRGTVDLMGFGSSKTYVGGNVSRLRVLLENQAQAEVAGAVTNLLAEVNGSARLEVKQPVHEAHCDVSGAGHVRLARVQRLSGSCSSRARMDADVERRRMPIAG